MPFRSRAQQRFAFATDQPWAERWAAETPSFERLPERRAKKMMMRRRGGMKAEIADRIAGELCRAIDGRYVSCSSSEATAESKRALRNKERKMERQAEQAATAVQMAADLGLEASTLGSFYQFADRDSPADLPQESVGPLSDMGLVETGDDGKPRITSAGRSFLDAARNGDEARARDALSRGGERTRAKAAREAAAAEREAEAEEKKKSGGGGGGGSAKPDKEAEARAKAQKERAKNRQLMAEFRDDPDSLTINERRRLEQAGLLEQVDGRWQAATKADAPAPPKDRIRGSAVNKPGSAAGAGSGRDIEITEAVETALRNKMEAHNEAHDEPGKRATMGMLRSVWRRGAGAFSVSHRPGMTRQQWAMARVNSFLTLLRRGRPENARYVTDNDLLPEDHPKSTRRDGQKAAESYTPPASVRAAARRALEVREEAAPSNRGMTPVGLARARDLSNGRPVSVETLRRMKAYFDRHEIDKQGSTWGERGKGWQAWYGWGGDAGRSWANGILRSVDAEDGQKQSAQQRAIHAKLGGSGGGGGGGGGGGSASGGAAGGGAAVTQQWATGKDGKRHPTEEQKTARVAALSDKRDQLRQKAAAAPEGSRQRAAAERAVAKVDGKIRDTEKRPTLDQVNTSVQQRRSERLQAQADRARRAADSGQMTPAQAERARQRAENLEARAKGQPVPNRQNRIKPIPQDDPAVAEAIATKQRINDRLSEIMAMSDPVAQVAALRQMQDELGLGPGKPESEQTPAKVRGKRTGDESIAYSGDGKTKYRLTHQIREMDDVQASNSPDGRVNPNYDKALQPRDRDRAASQQQVQRMAQTLNPDMIVYDTHRIGDGSPIIDADGNVLSGNGRTMSMMMAREQFPDNYASYKQRMREEAIKLGIDPAEVDKMKNPVLVRVLDPSVDREMFAREANASQTLRMSTMEDAKNDRKIMPNSLLASLSVRENQDIEAALKSDDNEVFVRTFLGKLPANERAAITQQTGELNLDGLRRIKAAIYVSTFDSAAGEKMAEALLESTSPDMRNVQNAIGGALPGLSRVKALMKENARDSDLDITRDMAEAIDFIARVRSNPAWTENVPAARQITNYIENNRAAGNRSALPPEGVERLALKIDTLRNQPKQLREWINSYSTAVANQPDPRQAGLAEGMRLDRNGLFTFLGLPDVIKVEGEQVGMFDL